MVFCIPGCFAEKKLSLRYDQKELILKVVTDTVTATISIFTFISIEYIEGY